MTHYIFFDLNGTLLADDAESLDVEPGTMNIFLRQLSELEKMGVNVGLCSDSPLKNLKGILPAFGFKEDSFVLAENGNVIYSQYEKTFLRSLSQSQKSQIILLAAEVGKRLELTHINSIEAVEFTGIKYDLSRFWAFGANRETSISIFGPEHFIEELGREINTFRIANGKNIDVDISPENNFLGIHPIEDLKKGKTKSLEWMLDNQEKLGVKIDDIYMVGNSNSDIIVSDRKNIFTYLVGNHIADKNLDFVDYVANKNYFDGVVEIVEKISNDIQFSRKVNLAI